MLSSYMGFWDTWDSDGIHLVTFDGLNRLIIIKPGIVNLDVKKHMYSAWKQWMLFNETTNMKYVHAFIGAGGDTISATAELGSTFFLENGWRIKPWNGHTSINLTGNIYVREGGRPVVPDDNGIDAVSLTVSNLVDTVIVDVSPEYDFSAPIWDGPIGIVDCYQDGKFITARWSAANDANRIRYKVYIASTDTSVVHSSNFYGSFTGNMANLSTESDGVTPLSGGLYYVAVTAIDESDNETTNTNYAIIDFDMNLAVPLTAQAIWEYTTRTLTSAGAGGATAQEVWEYATRELTAGSGLDEAELHASLDTYINKDNWKADVSNLSADVNIVEVQGVPVVSVDDFKADTVNVDLSGIPADVWSYVQRELTVAAGLTPEQELKLDDILSSINSTKGKLLV